MRMSLENDMNPALPPPFMKLTDGADPSLVESWDAWSVTPTGDHKTDYLQGAAYCDIALRKVIATNNPAALDIVVVTIVRKISAGLIKKGAMEKGFMDRLVSLASDRRQQLDQN